MIDIAGYYGQNPLLTLYIICFVGVFGLVIGSFLNVVGLRLLSGESIVLPPSKCPKCKTKLKWYDNIPVLAYILLRGKCRYCKEPISIQYPIVEAITSAIFVLLFLKFGFSIATIMLWILAGASIAMCITDFREQVIFDAVSIPLIPIGLLFSFFNFGRYSSENISVLNFQIPDIFISAIVGVIIAFLIFESISIVSRIIIGQRAFGEGDTIIAMIFGAWFGWKAMLLTIVLGFVVQVIFTLPILFTKLIKTKDKQANISFAILIFSAIAPIVLNQFEFFYTQIGSIILITTTLSTATISALFFLKRIKSLNAYTILPFGPALITGGFVTIFFGEHIIKFLEHLGF